MNTNKAVSMISLVLTIAIIIILAAITAPLLSNVLTDSTKLDAKEELANVLAVVQSAKKDIMIDRFVPNPKYIISDNDLALLHKTNIITDEEYEKISGDNHSSSLGLPYKYYYMDQKSFDEEFNNDVSVDRMREDRKYLVNYMDEVVILSYDGQRYAMGDVTDIDPVVRGDVKVVFTPNGNAEWKKQQSVDVELKYEPTTTVYDTAKYIWWDHPDEAPDFDDTSIPANHRGTVSTTGRTTAKLGEGGDDTGNGWFLWVKVEYDDDGIRREKIEKSGAFFVDNENPTFDLEVN